MGKWGCETDVLRLGALLEGARPWAQHRLEKIDELQQVGVSGEALQDFQRLGTLTSLYYAVEARGSVGDMVQQITALIRTGGDQASQTLYWRVQ